MPCYKPITAYLSEERNPKTGKRSLTWDYKKVSAVNPQLVTVPCGQCIGCRLERSRQWAIRCIHEASLYDKNCFITLTYNDEHLPSNGSLVKRDFQLFMKRLRKKYGKGVRYYECGEYGEKLQRPHYHACLFNFDFADKELWSVREGVSLYRSGSLESLWTLGHSTIGDVTFESAAYVARYCTKKITGEKAKEAYKGKVPEYVTMSRRPGIAHDWFEKYKSDVYPDDFVVIRNGLKCKPPKYYDQMYDDVNPDGMSELKRERKVSAEKNPNNSYERLKVREKVKLLKAKKLRRGYEKEGI